MERKTHNIKWDIVCSITAKGGLGIPKLSIFNRVLLGDWCWRFGAETGALWEAIISLKYGIEEGGWTTKVMRGSYWWIYGKKFRRKPLIKTEQQPCAWRWKQGKILRGCLV